MNRYVLAAIVLTCALASAWAGNRTYPIDSRAMKLHKAVPLKHGIEKADWTGNVVLRGQLSLDLDRVAVPEPDGPSEAEIAAWPDVDHIWTTLSFKPNKSSAVQLPVVGGDVYPREVAYLVMRTGNISELGLKTLLPTAVIRAIRNEKFGHYEWAATVVLKRLETDIGNDGRDFFAKKYSVSVDLKTLSRGSRPKNLCC